MVLVWGGWGRLGSCRRFRVFRNKERNASRKTSPSRCPAPDLRSGPAIFCRKRSRCRLCPLGRLGSLASLPVLLRIAGVRIVIAKGTGLALIFVIAHLPFAMFVFWWVIMPPTGAWVTITITAFASRLIIITVGFNGRRRMFTMSAWRHFTPPFTHNWSNGTDLKLVYFIGFVNCPPPLA